jgi:hypothetical protein
VGRNRRGHQNTGSPGALRSLADIERKGWPVTELHFAQGIAKKEKLKDFVIPLHIDDLPHGEITIEITRLNTVPFTQSWGAKLAKLLEKLEKTRSPKTRNSTGRPSTNGGARSSAQSRGCARSPKSTSPTGFP